MKITVITLILLFCLINTGQTVESIDSQYWQLTFVYNKFGISLEKATPIVDMPKTPFSPGERGGSIAVPFTIEWLSSDNHQIYNSDIKLKLGGMENSIQDQNFGVIPVDGAIVVRVLGPHVNLEPNAINLIKGNIAPEVGYDLPSSFSQSYFSININQTIDKSNLADGFMSSHKIWDSGPDDNRYVIVVLSDGYTEEDINSGAFSEDVNRVILTPFTTKAPWNELKEAMNMYLINVASNETGIDNVPCASYYDTYFDVRSAQCGGQVAEFGPGGAQRAFDAADAVVGAGKWDFIIVLANNPNWYLNSSIPFIMTSDNYLSNVGAIIHEFGHYGGPNLLDEYTYSPMSSCYPLSPGASFPNLCATYELATLPWKNWVELGTPLPTPDLSSNSTVVGAFLGGMYCTSSNYRPMRDCLMKFDSPYDPFCHVCCEAHWMMFINQLNYADDITPPMGADILVENNPWNFIIETINWNYFSFEWKLAGNILTETGNQLVINSTDLLQRGLDTATLEVSLSMATDQIRFELPVETYHWHLSLCSDPIDTDNDGVSDNCDNCPAISNPEQDDIDKDNIGDVCDDCIDLDADGYGDPGFGNSCPEDNCPDIYNPDQNDTDSDGIGDVCDAREVIMDTIAATCTQLIVGDDGSYGLMGLGGANMDYTASGDCEANARVYLFAGSPVIAYLDQYGTKIANNACFDHRDFGLAWHGHLTTPTQIWPDYQKFESGTLITADSTFAMEISWFAPTGADSCHFLIQKKKVYLNNNNSFSNLMIGDAIDWDIPFNPNVGGYDSTYNTIYQYGQGTTCQDNSRRFGAITFLASQMNSESLQTKPYGAYVDRNSLYVLSNDGFVKDELYDNMNQSGYRVVPNIEDLHSVMIYNGNLTLENTDTITIYSALSTIQNGTIDDLRNSINQARRWAVSQLGLELGCCLGVRGNIDNDSLDYIEITDLVYLVDYQFRSGPAPACFEESDLVIDGLIDISDLVFMVDYQFRKGDSPPDCF